MKSTLIIAVIALVLGVIAGVNIHKFQARQHEKTTATMVLLQLHLKSWESAVQDKQCPRAQSELMSLKFLSQEIGVVLPLADSQDTAFHQHAVKLEQELDAAASRQCAVSMTEIKSVREACNECHREYR